MNSAESFQQGYRLGGLLPWSPRDCSFVKKICNKKIKLSVDADERVGRIEEIILSIATFCHVKIVLVEFNPTRKSFGKVSEKNQQNSLGN